MFIGGSAAETLQEWRVYMAIASNAQRTIDERLRVNTAFLKWRGTSMHARRWASPTWQQIAQFLDSTATSPASRRAYLSAIRAFVKWLIGTERLNVDPTAKLPRIKVPSALPRPVSTDQLTAALGIGVCYSRTRTMIVLAAYQGLRIHEIAKIRGEDIRDGSLRVQGKGGRVEMLPLHPMVATEASRYPVVGFWFTSPRDRTRSIQPRSVGRVVAQALQRAGVDATAHQLRHWYGTETLRACGNLRTTQELMRHASPATTAIYTRVDDEQRRAALLGLPLCAL